MAILKKVISVLAYFFLIFLAVEGFKWVTRNYSLTFVLIGAGILGIGMLIVIGVNVYKQIVK